MSNCTHYEKHELAQAEYDEWIRSKVTASRADTRPRMTTEQVRQTLQARHQELKALRDSV